MKHRFNSPPPKIVTAIGCVRGQVYKQRTSSNSDPLLIATNMWENGCRKFVSTAGDIVHINRYQELEYLPNAELVIND